MIEKFRAGELHSCLHHSSDNDLLSWGGILTFGDQVYFDHKLQNLQDTARLLIRLNRFFHLGKNRNRSNRFIAIYCDFLRFFSRKSNYAPGKD